MKYIILLLLISIACTASAQINVTPAVIGQPLPDFEFDVKYEEPGKKKLSALKGKPVLLVFFGKGCIGSFHGLHKLNTLYKKYSKQITFIGKAADKGDRVGESYERYRKHYKLELPVAVDSIVYKQLGIAPMPTTGWNGAARSRTRKSMLRPGTLVY